MRRGQRRHVEVAGDLTLAAMVDVFVNLLIFLLHLYGTGSATASELELAKSSAVDPVLPGVTVTVSREAVLVGGTRVGTLAEVEADAGVLTETLRQAAGRLMAEVDPSALPPGGPPVLMLSLEVDRRVPWTALRPVLKSAGTAGFADLKFAVASASEEKPG